MLFIRNVHPASVRSSWLALSIVWAWKVTKTMDLAKVAEVEVQGASVPSTADFHSA